MKLEIKPLSQRDARWKLKKLGTSDVSIGNYGCLLVDHCMMLNYYGKDFTPDSLNEYYKSKGVFDQGNQINFWAAANCFEDITADEYYNCYDTPCDLEKIDKYLSQGKPVICLVDFSPTAGVQTHFVLIIGKDNDYLVNDPWTGETYWFEAKYGDPTRYIYGLRFYSGKVPIGGETVESLLAKNKELSEKLAVEIQSNSELRTRVVQFQSDLAEQDKKMAELIEENRKAEIDKQNAEKEVSELWGRLDTLLNENTALQQALKSSEALGIEGISTLELALLVIKRILRR